MYNKYNVMSALPSEMKNSSFHEVLFNASRVCNVPLYL